MYLNCYILILILFLTCFFCIIGGDIVVSPARMVATLQVPLQSHHFEAPRLENCCEFLSLYLLRLCSWLKMVFVKVSVAPCHSFPCLLLLLAELWIRVILVRIRMRIRILWSVGYLCITDPYADPGDPITQGCGSGTLIKSRKEVTSLAIFGWWWNDPDPTLWLTDPEADPWGPKSKNIRSRMRILIHNTVF
jgi:hypothetical protein